MLARFMTVVCLLVGLVGVARGEIYTVEWTGEEGSAHNPSWIGTVDTSLDVLLIGDKIWPAVQQSVIHDIYNGKPCIGSDYPGWFECGVLKYDIPDDWDGTMSSEWGFISRPDAGERTCNTWGCFWAGIGCYRFDEAIVTIGSGWWSMGPWWKEVRFIDSYADDGTPIWSRMEIEESVRPRRINVTPISPSRIAGDVNFDGLFNSNDVVGVFSGGLYETGLFAEWPEGDWTGDGVFDSNDFVAAFQTGKYEQGPSAVAVPEPSSLLLALVGCLFIVYRKSSR